MLQRSLPQVNQLGGLLVQCILQGPAGAALDQLLNTAFSMRMPEAGTSGTSAWASIRAPPAANIPSLMHIKQASSPACHTSTPLLVRVGQRFQQVLCGLSYRTTGRK